MRYLIFALIFFLSGSLALANCDDGETKIRFGTYTNSDHNNRENATKLLQHHINKEFQGKFCMEVVKDEGRFKGALAMTALQNREVELIAPSFATLGQFSKLYRIFDLPFAFEDIQSVEKFQLARSKDFVDAIAKNAAQPLAFWHGAFSHISAKRPVYKPFDVAGMKFRVDKGFYFRSEMTRFKSTAQPIAENDLTIAFQSGKINAQYSNWVQLSADGTAKILDGVTQTRHRFSGYQLMTSQKWWAAQDKATKKALINLISRISNQTNIDAINRARFAKRILMRSGVAVRVLTRAQRAVWKNTMLPIWEDSDFTDTLEIMDTVKQASKRP